jgi:hypothetical protein
LGNGASVLAEALATGNPGTCYTQDNLDTETGAMAGPIEDGVNTRFGFYSSSFNKAKGDYRYRPAVNVRSARTITKGKPGCDIYDPVKVGEVVGDATKALPLGYGAGMTSLAGGKISSANNWQYTTYWNVAQGTAAPSVSTVLSNYSSYPAQAAGTPSRPSAYDVYRFELANPSLINHASANGETGKPTTGGQCYTGPDLSNYTAAEYGDRREIFSAIVNCGYEASVGHLNGHKATRAVAFARMFLTKPAIKDSNERYLSLEMIDITGKGGRGTADEFLREEAELVR